jgi:hypothetical protein
LDNVLAIKNVIDNFAAAPRRIGAGATIVDHFTFEKGHRKRAAAKAGRTFGKRVLSLGNTKRRNAISARRSNN